MDGTTLGAALKAAREAKGWSQAEVAARLGVRQPTIANYEAGKRTLDVPTLRRLEAALGVSFSGDQPDAASRSALWVAQGEFNALAGMAEAMAAQARAASARIAAATLPGAGDVRARGTAALAALDAAHGPRASAATGPARRRSGGR